MLTCVHTHMDVSMHLHRRSLSLSLFTSSQLPPDKLSYAPLTPNQHTLWQPCIDWMLFYQSVELPILFVSLPALSRSHSQNTHTHTLLTQYCYTDCVGSAQTWYFSLCGWRSFSFSLSHCLPVFLTLSACLSQSLSLPPLPPPSNRTPISSLPPSSLSLSLTHTHTKAHTS